MMSPTERRQERILHLERELAKERNAQACIERTPPEARTIFQLEMIRHHLHMQETITNMLRGNP